MKAKRFIAITAVIHNKKVIAINTTARRCLFNENGLTTEQILEFLFSLHLLRKHEYNIAFITCDFVKENEFIFAGLPTFLKDKLFESFRIREEKDELEYEQDVISQVFYHAERDSQEFEQADFEKHVLELSLQELNEV